MKPKIWKFTLENDTKINLKEILGGVANYEFFDVVNGRRELVGIVINGILTIFKGYTWDGCTPKFPFFGCLLGVPDYKGTYLASLTHDFLIEYKNQHRLTRKQMDLVFSFILKEEKFACRWVYSGAVNLYRPFSGAVELFSIFSDILRHGGDLD